MIQAINLLVEELIAIAASIATPLGGRDNGHAGMLMEDMEYMAEFGAIQAFVPPANLGIYPAGIYPNRT